jgi:hypothetical protein
MNEKPIHLKANHAWSWHDPICRDYTIEDVAYMHSYLWATGHFQRLGLDLRPAGCSFIVDKFLEMFPDANVKSLRSIVALGGYTKDWLSTTYGFKFR